MASLNKTILIGHIGKDPEGRYTANGDAVSNFSVATSESWKDKATGEKKELTEWHRCSVFGKLAEICNEYLRKGSLVYVEGKLTTRKWQDKEGQDRYTTEIKVDQMKMLGGRSENTGEQNGASSANSRDDGYAPAAQRQAPQKRDAFDDLGDDIPF